MFKTISFLKENLKGFHKNEHILLRKATPLQSASMYWVSIGPFLKKRRRCIVVGPTWGQQE